MFIVAVQGADMNADSRRRYQKSQEDLSRIYAAKEAEFNAKLDALAHANASLGQTTTQARPNSKTVSVEASASDAAATSNTTTVLVGGESMEVPKSFEEVHQLSQRNRQRQKDHRLNESKARQRRAGEEEYAQDNDFPMDVAGGAEQSWDTQAVKVDPDFYFSAASDANVDCGVDGTVRFLTSLALFPTSSFCVYEPTRCTYLLFEIYIIHFY